MTEATERWMADELRARGGKEKQASWRTSATDPTALGTAPARTAMAVSSKRLKQPPLHAPSPAGVLHRRAAVHGGDRVRTILFNLTENVVKAFEVVKARVAELIGHHPDYLLSEHKLNLVQINEILEDLMRLAIESKEEAINIGRGAEKEAFTDDTKVFDNDKLPCDWTSSEEPGRFVGSEDGHHSDYSCDSKLSGIPAGFNPFVDNSD